METAGTKLRFSIGVYAHETVAFTPSQSSPQSGDSEVRGHLGANGVPHDPVVEQILDRAAVSLPSPAGCSVKSVIQLRFGPPAVTSQHRRSSLTGGPSRLPLWPSFTVADDRFCWKKTAMRAVPRTRRLPTSTSAKNREPNARSSPRASSSECITRTSSRSRN